MTASRLSACGGADAEGARSVEVVRGRRHHLGGAKRGRRDFFERRAPPSPPSSARRSPRGPSRARRRLSSLALTPPSRSVIGFGRGRACDGAAGSDRATVFGPLVKSSQRSRSPTAPRFLFSLLVPTKGSHLGERPPEFPARGRGRHVLPRGLALPGVPRHAVQAGGERVRARLLLLVRPPRDGRPGDEPLPFVSR